MKKLISFVITILFAVTLVPILNLKANATTKTQGFYEEVTVFDAAKDGYPAVRIPGIVTTGDGSLLAYCEGRSSGSDWSNMDVAMKKSTDGGKNWGPVKVLADGINNKIVYNNPVMIPEKNSNEVHLIYQTGYARAYYRKSLDNGDTWSEPVEITKTFEACKGEYDWKVIATGPGHGIELENGRLLVPVWLSLNTSHSPSITSSIYSDDGGNTWTLGELIKAESYMSNPNETTAVELSNGDVLMNMRNTSSVKKRALTKSSDGNSNWSKPVMSEDLDDPTCFGSMVKLTSRNEYYTDRILFSNANNVGSRNNLVVKMSMDDGESWTTTKTIKAGNAAYSDMAVSNDKSEIYTLYEPNDLKTIKLIRFNLEWLTDGEQSLDKKVGEPTKANIPNTKFSLNEEWEKTDPSWVLNVVEPIDIAGGQLHLSSQGVQKEIINKDVNIQESYSYETKVKVNDYFEGTTGNNVTFGTKINDGRYRLMLDLKKDGVYALTSAGTWQKIGNSTIDNNWHTYKAIVDRGYVKLYIDEAYIGDFRLQALNDKDHIQHWVSGTTTDKTEVYQEYVKISKITPNVDLNSINKSTMTATASSEEISKAQNGAANILDNNASTIWHSNWDTSLLPISITVDMKNSAKLSKIGFTPRQEGGNNGLITQYELQVSNDGTEFTKVSEGTWSYGATATDRSEKIVSFNEVTARYVKLVALKSYDGKFATLGDIKFYREGVSLKKVNDINLSTTKGTAPILPKSVQGILSNDDIVTLPVAWQEYDAYDCINKSSFIVNGTVNGTIVTLNVNITVNNSPLIHDDLQIETYKEQMPNLPESIEVKYTGGESNVHGVTWDKIDESSYSKLGTFEVNGKIQGINSKIKSIVTVVDKPGFEIEDLNKDGIVNIRDLGIVSKFYGKTSELNADIWDQIKIYDINLDNKIDDYEINAISEKILE